jgi:hypothetical protein
MICDVSFRETLSDKKEELMTNQENAKKDDTGCCQAEAAKKEQAALEAAKAEQKEEGSCSTGGCGCG